MSRSRAAILNWFASILYMIVTMLTGLITTPMIFRPLGVDEFGVQRTLTGIFAYFTLIAHGLSIAFVPLLAKSKAKQDEQVLRMMLSAAFRCYGIAVCIIVVLGLASMPALPYMVPAPRNILPEVRLSWIVSLAGLPFLVALPLKILIEIDQRGYLVTMALVAQSLVTTILSVVLVRRDWGILGIMVATLVGTGVFTLIILLIALQSYRKLLKGIHRVPTAGEDWGKILSLSWPTFLSMLSSQLGTFSDSIVLANVRGPAAVAVLAMNQRLATMVWTVLRAMNTSIWPGLVQLHNTGEHDLFNRRLVELVRIIAVLAVAALIPVVVLNEPFVSRWIDDPDVHPSTMLAAVAALDTFLMSITSLFSLPLVTTGKVKLIAGPAMIGAAINIAISIVFARLLGPVGPLIGTAVALSAVNLWYYPKLLESNFGVSPSAILGTMVLPLAWAVPYTAAVWLFVEAVRPSSLLTMFATIAAAASLFLAFSYVAILCREERLLWRGRLIAPLLRRFSRA